MQLTQFFCLLLCPFPCVIQEEDSEQEGEEPSFEKQEAMVRKLQRKFQDQDKEVCVCV